MRTAIATLVIDTCLSALTLGLRTVSGEVVSLSEEIGIGHAEKIAPAFAQLLSEAGIKTGDLRRIGVTVGPGSFMGQRVGIAFAKGLVLGSGAETVPLTTLEALAWGQGACSVAIDARRGQVYFQRFREGCRADGDPELLSYSEAASRLGPERLIGSGIAASSGKAGEGPLVPSAEALLALASERSAEALRTLYLRAPDAKPPSAPSL